MQACMWHQCSSPILTVGSAEVQAQQPGQDCELAWSLKIVCCSSQACVSSMAQPVPYLAMQVRCKSSRAGLCRSVATERSFNSTMDRVEQELQGTGGSILPGPGLVAGGAPAAMLPSLGHRVAQTLCIAFVSIVMSSTRVLNCIPAVPCAQKTTRNACWCAGHSVCAISGAHCVLYDLLQGIGGPRPRVSCFENLPGFAYFSVTMASQLGACTEVEAAWYMHEYSACYTHMHGHAVS